VAGSISLLTQLVLSRREHVRWLAGYSITRKLDALSAFWVAVAEWHDVIVEKHSEWEAGKYDHAWADILAPFPSRSLRALRIIQPYLEAGEFRTFKVLCNGLELAGQQVLVNPKAPGFQQGELPTKSREKRWSDLEAAYDTAVGQMSELFKHKLLKKLAG
jgi:hypothetical protein